MCINVKTRVTSSTDIIIVLNRGAGAGPTGTAAAGPMLEAKLMNLIKSRLQSSDSAIILA